MNVTVSAQDPTTISADVLIVNVFEGEQPATGALAAIDQKLQGVLGRLANLGDLPGKLYQTMLLPTAGAIAAPRLLLIGSGKPRDFDLVRARRVAGAAIRTAQRSSVQSAALQIHGGTGGVPEAEALSVGAVTATFKVGEYKTEKPETPQHEITDLTLIAPSPTALPEWEQGGTRGRIIGDAVNLSRHLAQAPGNLLTPQKLAEQAKAAGQQAGFSVDVLDRSRMAQLGMGALLGVAEGSEQPPAMIVMTHRGRGGEGHDLAIIGKGVTFDTGGISIKPAAEMHLMKEDMAGAAATVAAMKAIAQLGVKANVLGIIPAVENMPSGHSMRPGDVLTAMNGKTIEVLNTDAEGRLILADAVAYAQSLGAKRLVDAATLTGAVVIALGHEASALLGTPQPWLDQVKAAADRAGERIWQLPLWEEYAEQLRSTIADVANIGGRPGGTITGAMFIRQFVNEGTEWAHLDIAGTAWTERDQPYLPKSPTGHPTRIFIQLAESVVGSP